MNLLAVFEDFFEILTPAFMLGLAAVITSCGGIISAIISIQAAKREATVKAQDECQQRLRAVQVEADRYLEELHNYRKQQWQS